MLYSCFLGGAYKRADTGVVNRVSGIRGAILEYPSAIYDRVLVGKHSEPIGYQSRSDV
jgi:hypothetical protein